MDSPNGTPHAEPDPTPSAPPFPHAKWLERDDFDAVRALLDVCPPGKDLAEASVYLSQGSGMFADFQCVEIPRTDKAGGHCVAVVPARPCEWDDVKGKAFFFVVAGRPTWPARRGAAKKQ